MLESLGRLGNLRRGTPFTFNDKITYMVVSNINGKVKYRRIWRSHKNNIFIEADIDNLFEWYNKNCNRPAFTTIYEGNEDKEVFDFLPF